MGTTLTGTTPQDTYDSLIKVTDNGPLSGTAKYLSDGLGNDSVLALSTSSVGIGTNAPTFKLQINSAASATAMFRSSDANTVVGIDNSAADGDPQLKFFINDIGTFTLGVDDSDSDKFKIGTSDLTTSTRLTIDSTGNVGIGTSAPDDTLHLNKSGAGLYNAVHYTNPNSTASLFVGIAGSSVANGSLQNNAYVYNAAASAIVFGTSDTERMRITSDGYMRMAASTGGIQFNGDTAAANALDDYEEGTWTPSLGGNTTYSAQAGTYTKIGRQVVINFAVGVTTLGTGSASDILGLPFTSGNISRGGGGVAFVQNPSTAYASINPIVSVTSSSVTFVTSTILGVYADQSNVFANGTTISGTVTYFV